MQKQEIISKEMVAINRKLVIAMCVTILSMACNLLVFLVRYWRVNETASFHNRIGFGFLFTTLVLQVALSEIENRPRLVGVCLNVSWLLLAYSVLLIYW